MLSSSMVELQELYKHPLVQELIEQNQMMADQMPEAGLQHLSLSNKKINLDNIKVPHTIKNRLLFQEGEHNGLFYPGEEIKENLELWENNDLMFAEHTDASNSWVGLTRNPRYNEEEKAIYGDLEIVDKGVAQKLEFQVLNKDGHMGISPTIDVDKKLIQGKMCAMGPYTLKSQSIVLDPAVKTTMFNSAHGGAGMEPNNNNENIQNLKKDEIAVKKEELEKYKESEKQLADYKKKELAVDVEELAKLEVAIGRTTEENLAARTEILMKLSTEERKILKDSYNWVADELSEKSPEETFMDTLSEEMRGKVPPGLRKFIEEKKLKKAEEDMAHLTPEQRKKKEEEEEMAGHMTPAQIKKKEEEERNLANKDKKPGQKLNESFENLSNSTEQLVGRSNLNRFQELSAANKEENEKMIDFFLINQGDKARGGA